MKETVIVEKGKVELRNPILIEGLPGLGIVGKIVAEYLIKHLDAKEFAELYSPHFAYYVIVEKDGSVRLLRNVFYYWENEGGGNDLILLTGDSQAQTVEGQYEVADRILDFARKNNVKLIITVGGYRDKVEGEPKVIATSTNPQILNRALEAGAVSSPLGNPIVGMAGLILGLARLKGIDALCLLGETLGYMPDPRAAKSVLKVLSRLLGITIDLADIDGEIAKLEERMERVRELEEKRRIFEQRKKMTEEEKVTYIS